jgi:transmembrane protein 70
MLTIIRNLVVCQPTNIFRLNSIIRLACSLQQQHKEHSIKAKDFFIDPNLKQAFEKIKKGDFIPPVIETASLEHLRDSPPIDIKHDNQLSKRENSRQELLGKLVYVGKLDKPFKAAKSLSLASSIGGAVCYPIMIPKILEEASIYVAIGYTIISATFVLLSPSLIQLICKRYLTSLYYQENTGQFTGFYKNFFMIERQIRFRAEDVQVPPLTGMFTSMLIKNQPFFINHDDFYDKPVLTKMLGYDKEFDFSKYTKDIQNDDDDDVNNKRTK